MPADPSEWLPSERAAELTGLTTRHLAKLARKGLLSRRNVPCSRPAYLRSEIQALVESCTRPRRSRASAG